MSNELELFVTFNGFSLVELYGVVKENPSACRCKLGSDCKTPGKHPVHTEWNKKSVTEIREGYNYGIICGNGLVVIDVDERNGGIESLQNYEQAFGKLPKTLTVKTGNGFHYYFKTDKKDLRSFKPKMFCGIDIQSNGSLVVCPPSQHYSGKFYTFVDSEQEIASLPQEILDLAPAHNIEKINSESKEPEVYSKDELIAALEYIDPNCSYDLWWKTGAALFNSGVDFEVFNAWSAKSKSKYDEQATIKKWKSFSDKNPSGISCGTLIYNAKLNGFKKEELDIELTFSTQEPVEKEEPEVDVFQELQCAVDFPQGDIGVIAKWIYDNAMYRNKACAIQAALSVAAGVTQGGVRTNLMDGKLSTISIIVAPPASGKGHYTECVSRIINEVDKQLRLGLVQSKQAFHASLYQCNNRIIVQAESLSFFQKICNEKNQVMNQIVESLLTTWDSTNWLDALVTKKVSNTIPGIPEPHLTLLGGGVPHDLLQLVNNHIFTSSGLMSRIDLIIAKDFIGNNSKENTYEFSQELKDIIKRLKIIRELCKPDRSMDINMDDTDTTVTTHFQKTFSVSVSGISERRNEISAYFDTLKLKSIANGFSSDFIDIVDGVFNRCKEKVLRIACALSAIDQFNINSKVCSLHHLEWAFAWEKSVCYELIKFLEVALGTNFETELLEYLKKALIEHSQKTGKKEFTYSEVYSKKKKTLSRYRKKSIEDALGLLELQGFLVIKSKTCGCRIVLT